jgi:hypothetical protein
MASELDARRMHLIFASLFIFFPSGKNVLLEVEKLVFRCLNSGYLSKRKAVPTQLTEIYF